MELKGKMCPYCKTPLDDGETVVICDTCDMPHHLSCWQENQGCTTFGCTGSIGEILERKSGGSAMPMAGRNTPVRTVQPQRRGNTVAGISMTQAPAARTHPLEQRMPIPRSSQARGGSRGAPEPIVRQAVAVSTGRTNPNAPQTRTAAPMPEAFVHRFAQSKPLALEVLHEDARCVIQENSPVILEKIVLLIDRMQEMLYVRCTFRNMHGVPVRAMQVRIGCSDVWGEIAEQSVDYQYMDLNAAGGEQFGQEVTIPLVKGAVRRIQVTVLKVLMLDETVINCGEKKSQLPEAEPLETYLYDPRLVHEYAGIVTPYARYVPFITDAAWRCTCGAVNLMKVMQCVACRADRRLMLEALDRDKLQETVARKEEEKRMERELERELEELERAEKIRLEEEEKQRAIAYQESFEREEKRKKRNRKLATGVIMTVSLALVSVFVGIFAVRPYYEYRIAKEALEACNYEDAYVRFIALENYSDSERMAKEALYQQANDLKQKEEYEKALDVLTRIEDYRDSGEIALACRYSIGIAQLDSGEYEKAIETFGQIESYTDSAEKILAAKYAYVKANFNNDDDITYAYLKDLKGVYYSDAIKMYNELYTWKVEIIGWSAGAEDSMYVDTFKRKQPVYCHFKVSGGMPEESVEIKYSASVSEITVVSDEKYNNGAMLTDGDVGLICFEEGIKESGVLKITLKDNKNKILCGGNVTITK